MSTFDELNKMDIIATKFSAARLHFLSDVLVTVAVVVAYKLSRDLSDFFLELSQARNFSRSKVHFSDLEVCCDWSSFFFSLKSADVSGAATRDEPLRTSAWKTAAVRVSRT